MPSSVEIRVLGAFDVFVDQRPIVIGSDKQRRLLAALTLHANDVVSEDRLVDLVWSDSTPDTARRTLQKYVYRLRGALAGGIDGTSGVSLDTGAHGYVLRLDASALLDAREFERLTSEARSTTNTAPQRAIELYDEALRLWRGPAWEEFTDGDSFRADAVRLDSMRGVAMEERADLGLRLGRHGELIGELEALAESFPLRERPRALLMLALYRDGRQADALRVFQEFRTYLIEETGLEPSDGLHRLDADIARRESHLDVARDDDESFPRRVLDRIEVEAVLTRTVGSVSPELIAAVLAETAGDASLVLELGQSMRARDMTARLERALRRAEAASLELDEAQEELETRAFDASAGRTGRSPGARVGVCPYKGLARFEAVDAGLYRGRDRLVASVIARLAVSRFVAVVGTSGSGKSSLLRAGVVPALARGGLPGSDGWTTTVVTPGDDPVPRFLDALTPADGASSDARRLLVIDQFEELFTACRDPMRREQAVALLARAATDPLSLNIVIALRADYYGACAAHRELVALLERSQILVAAMTESELRDAVIEPAARVGLGVEGVLVDAICRDAQSEPGALPLVSTALLETWARHEGSTLTLADYVEVGGVRGAVARMADAAYDALEADEQSVARRIFVRLADPGEKDDVRRRAPRREVESITRSGPVLAALIDARLVTADAESVEIAHEALLREWPRLRGWLQEDRDGRQLHRRLTDAATAWDEEGHDPAQLYRGTRLEAVADWRTAHAGDLTSTETAFVKASSEARDDELRAIRRSVRRSRVAVAGLAVLLTLALVAASVSVVQWRRATQATARADTAARRAEIARLSQLASSLPSKQADLALLLAVEVHRLRPGPDTEGALESALNHVPPGLESIIGSTSGAFPDVSPDGRLLVEPVDDSTVVLVDLQSGDVTRLKTPPHTASAVFDKTGRQLAIGSSDGLVSIVDVATRQQSGASIDAGGGAVRGLWDPSNDATLYSIGDGGAVTRWDLRDPDHPQRVGDSFVLPAAQPDITLIVAISPDGHLLAASANAFQDDQSTTVWDVDTHAQLQVLTGTAAAFEPDNATLVVSAATTVTFVDARTAEPRSSPIAGLTNASLVALSADNQRLAVSEDQRRIKVFDLRDNTLHAVLDTPALPVRFLPDGRLLTVDQAHAALWDIDDRSGPLSTTLGGVPDDLVQARFTRNDTAVWALGLDDSQSTFWDAASRNTVESALPIHSSLVDVSRDGRLAVAADPDGSIALYDVASGERLSSIETSGGDVGASLSPSGSLLAVAPPSTGAQQVPLWDISDLHVPRLLATITVPGTLSPGVPSSLSVWFGPGGHEAAILDGVLGAITLLDVDRHEVRWTKSIGGAFREPAFTPDGATLAIGDERAGQTTLRFFDTRTGDERQSLSVGETVGVAYAQGGSMFVTTGVLATGQGGAQLWDAATNAPIGEPLTVNGDIATFDDASADGSHVVAGTEHGVATIWDVDVADWETAACAIAGRNLSRAEWSEYLPDELYRSTCSQWAPGR